MLGIGWQEFIVIIIVAVIVLGPKRIPEVARSIAKVMKEIIKAREQLKRKIQDELRVYESERKEAHK